MGVSTITAPDGRKFDVTHPDDATDDQILAYAKQQFAKMPPADTSRVRAVILGAEKSLDNLSVAASHIPIIGPAVDRFGQALGMPSAEQSAAIHQGARANNVRTNYQTIGNMAGTLPTAELKGGMLAQGAASGALLSDAKDLGGTIRDATIGAATSLGVGKGLQALGAFAQPIKNKAAVALHNAGIDLSPGQLLQVTGSAAGKAVRGFEDKARSWPIVGSFIGASRDRATTQLNQYLGNQALGAIGKTVPQNIAPGHDMLDYVANQLSNEYQKAIPHLVGKIDQKFGADIAAATAKTNPLPDAQQSQFGKILDDVLWNRTGPKPGQPATAKTLISGQGLKDAETDLGEWVRGFRNSPDVNQRRLGSALSDVQQALRNMAVRSNPQSGQQLQAINAGWAKLKQMQSAANVNGVVLPSALARVANKTGQGTQVARAASSILPDHIPNSGTADRWALAKAVALMMGGGEGAGMAFHSPIPGAAAGSILTLGGLASAPYTKMGTRAINSAAFANRPQVVQQAGRLIDLFSRGAPIVVPPLLAARRRSQP